jgi:GAF domain-containing protein
MPVTLTGQRGKLLETLGLLSSVQSVEELVMTLRGHARAIAQADGITVVRRDGDRVAYIAEDAVSPLWTGQDFPIESCISGIAMIENKPIVIPDIYADDRLPHAAYRSTFVRSMAMFPIGFSDPVLAMGAYWHEVREIDPETCALLTSLARSAAVTFERLTRPQAPRAARSLAAATRS